MGYAVVNLGDADSNNFVILAEGDTKAVGPSLFRKQLLKIGRWVHPNDPTKHMDITEEVIDKIVTNFNNKVLDNVPVPVTHTDDPTKNSGYVVGMEKTADGLDCLLEVKDADVATKIKQGLIPGISASIAWDYLKKDTGKLVGPVVRHAALVDNPYIKQLRGFDVVALSDTENAVPLTEYNKLPEGGKTMTLEEIKALLKKDHNISLDDLLAVDKKVKDGLLVEKTAGDAATAALCDKIKTALGDTVQLADSVTEEAIIAAVSNIAQTSKTVSGKVAELSDKLLSMEADGAVEALIKAGKVVPASKQSFVDLYKKDKAMFGTMTAGLPQIVSFGEQGGSQQVDLSDEAKLKAETERYEKMLGGAK